MRYIKRVLCFFGIHWSGIYGLGMYDDASRCDICGKDAYDLFIIHKRGYFHK